MISPPPVFDRVAKRQMLLIMLNLSMTSLVGNPAPIVEMVSNRIRYPQPGDLIYEASTAPWLVIRDLELTDSRWDGQFITYARTETGLVPAGDPEENEFFTETYWVCLNPDGTEYRWTNCDLRAVPNSYPFESTVPTATVL